MKVIQIGNVTEEHISRWKNPSVGRVYDPQGIAPCLNSMTGGGRTPLIIVRENVDCRNTTDGEDRVWEEDSETV